MFPPTKMLDMTDQINTQINVISVCSSSYQNNDINEFEKILKMNRRNIMEDPFIREHIEGTAL